MAVMAPTHWCAVPYLQRRKESSDRHIEPARVGAVQNLEQDDIIIDLARHRPEDHINFLVSKQTKGFFRKGTTVGLSLRVGE